MKHTVVGGRTIATTGNECVYCVHSEQTRPNRRTPPVHCDRCDRHIGRTRMVCLMDLDGTRWCMRCRVGDGSDAWWDAHKPIVSGTQAGVRLWLERWLAQER